MPAIEAYVTTRRALGAEFTHAAKILRSFGRTTGDVPIETIDGKQCEEFCWGLEHRRFQREKYITLNVFFRYLVGRGHLAVDPLLNPPRRVPSSFRPYIYCHEELNRLLEATTMLNSTKRWRTHPETLRTLLLLLYATGLRVGEALSLRCCDVDLAQRLLTIWNTKFFKSRLVPIGEHLSKVLGEYLKLRKTLPFPEAQQSRVFVFRTGKPLSYAAVKRDFALARRQASVRRPSGEHVQPRIHDLRATFAVHRLTAWYREGANVQARLPLLATYLGHSSIAGTVCYLSMTPTLLSEAALRFQRYAMPQKENDDD
jgi:site-specific recombinase XerD